ncbi:phage portal protein [Piscirickettsia litoralis]|uniref:Phage portal protein n=1 Tax=Piscirickettsia litoralis TaxID=1891921 RepID=A0ABX2ZZX6_9GAMM|nr:phage portal protein [Piscirickettsia litoralis]ODN41001.1 phage portal protein [Piscirickettsia litoralis]
MKFFKRWFGAATELEPDTEYGGYELLETFPASVSGQTVTPDNAMRLATVYSCIRVLAESIAALPLHLYKHKAGGGKELAKDHPLYSVLHDLPNRDVTSFDLRENLVGHLCLRGNAYCQIIRDGAGRVRELVQLPTDNTTVRRNEKTKKLVYATLLNGRDYELREDQVWRLNAMGSDGIIGSSPIALQRESLGLSAATQEHGAMLFGNGARPSGILTTDGRLNEEGRKALAESWKKAHGGKNANGVAVLEHNLKWQALTMTSEDSQFLETRKYQRNEICGIFRVPPHMIADLERATFSNIEHQDLAFVRHSLVPWLVKIEQSITRDLLLPSERKKYFVKFNIEGLLRGDTAARAAFYNRMFSIGVMSQNDIRALENMNPIEDGDRYFVPLNMTTVEELDKEQDNEKLVSDKSKS